MNSTPKRYLKKEPYITAIEIDNTWKYFLSQEHKHDCNVGDFYVEDGFGSYSIYERKYFLSLVQYPFVYDN